MERKEGREGRKEGRKEERKEGRKEGRKERNNCIFWAIPHTDRNFFCFSDKVFSWSDRNFSAGLGVVQQFSGPLFGPRLSLKHNLFFVLCRVWCLSQTATPIHLPFISYLASAHKTGKCNQLTLPSSGTIFNPLLINIFFKKRSDPSSSEFEKFIFSPFESYYYLSRSIHSEMF